MGKKDKKEEMRKKEESESEEEESSEEESSEEEAPPPKKGAAKKGKAAEPPKKKAKKVPARACRVCTSCALGLWPNALQRFGRVCLTASSASEGSFPEGRIVSPRVGGPQGPLAP